MEIVSQHGVKTREFFFFDLEMFGKLLEARWIGGSSFVQQSFRQRVEQEMEFVPLDLQRGQGGNDVINV